MMPSEQIDYTKHKWVLCVDSKMVNFLLDQQNGYTKFPWFLCMWGSRAKEEHWKRKDWPRWELKVSEKNIINAVLFPKEKVIFSPLHIKLGLMKQYAKSLDKESKCFEYICNSFPGLSTKKLKAGVFDGLDIRKLIKDDEFVNSMNDLELCTWTSFVDVVKNFSGNHQAKNYKELVEKLLKSLQNTGANISIKVHFLHRDLDRFLNKCGNMSDNQGEWFRQDIKTMEERYQERWDKQMIADYC